MATDRFSGPKAATTAQAQALAASLPPLMVEAERVANTVEQGIHGRRRVGPGESFWQFRRYDAGDTTTAVDWRQSARSEHLFVRENEWDAAQSVWIWCDRSPSMDYRSTLAPCTKQDRALVLGLAVTGLLVRGGERVAPLGTGEPPTGGRTGLNRLAQSWLTAQPAATGIPPLQSLPKYATLVLIGDFLDPAEDLVRALGTLARSGVRGHLLQVLDPAEADLPFEGRTEFEGVEEDLKLLVNRAESLRDAYRHRLSAHENRLADFTRSVGWTFARHLTGHPPTSALLALYGLLSGQLDAAPLERPQ